ncbi:hypothetical protein ACYFX5_13820 [Bremerella sp. T1]|uniref:hypothetical protein n=1 Tax=Bremerella sp. TYQ1 TaxID=3119568 RepID=UPI001CC9A04C|nr:hypothetical protein [Bremerella volcania]UBM34136.1 hypothetical protein LA756_15760 [Bremerella volcania]
MRRRMLKWIAGSFALGTAYVLGGKCFAPTSLHAADSADLKDTLERGLYARLPEQYEFIARVVFKVEQDELSLKLVYSTFKWARQYDKGRRYYYFEAAMRKRAGDLGVDF